MEGKNNNTAKILLVIVIILLAYFGVYYCYEMSKDQECNCVQAVNTGENNYMHVFSYLGENRYDLYAYLHNQGSSEQVIGYNGNLYY